MNTLKTGGIATYIIFSTPVYEVITNYKDLIVMFKSKEKALKNVHKL